MRYVIGIATILFVPLAIPAIIAAVITYVLITREK